MLLLCKVVVIFPLSFNWYSESGTTGPESLYDNVVPGAHSARPQRHGGEIACDVGKLPLKVFHGTQHAAVGLVGRRQAHRIRDDNGDELGASKRCADLQFETVGGSWNRDDSAGAHPGRRGALLLAAGEPIGKELGDL